MGYQRRLFICDRQRSENPRKRYCGAEFCEDCEYTIDPNHAFPEKEWKYFEKWSVPIYLVGEDE